jgi:hypothetical protein
MLGSKLSEPAPNKIKFEYVAIGEVNRILLPGQAPRFRTDGLWQHTCFEAFIGLPDGGYVEMNFAPSGQWASYRFSGYREGMQIAEDVTVAGMGYQKSDQRFWQVAEATLPFRVNLAECKLGLSAVIEEFDGTKSYWALAHPPGQPDFHHPTCFAATLPPPSNT